MPKIPKGRLTPKQAKFVEGLAKGKTHTQSALEAYDTDSEKVASVIAAENLGKPSIQQALEIARVELNITPERALKPIDEALNHEDLEMRLKGSDRALKIMNIGNKDGGGNTYIFNKGDIVKSKYVKD